MNSLAIPDNLFNAVNAMLAPYGVDMDRLTNPNCPKDDGKRYLSIGEAMEYCSVSRWTLSRAIKAGNLSALKLSNAKSGKILIDRSDLDKWLLDHKIKHRGEK
jgi:excisionase family DNA binding protein